MLYYTRCEDTESDINENEENKFMISLDTSNIMPFIAEGEMEKMLPQVEVAHNMIHKKTGPGSDFLGWVELPSKYDKNEFIRIRKAAAKIRKDSDVLLVIGIGGSY